MNAKKEIRKYIAPSIYLLLSSVLALAVIALSFRLSVIYDTEAALEEANPLL